ncbi:hypothetical protein ABB37_07783 [Leptomonas pyrrhocoris]|uniref:Uncharacterized protein n=1 Tax=Leptomonas pyrrhocoris TaxID=157538 RepID=A0A0N0VDT0_LEPPY|nr:hypothetical protein ABB37_07783 [Leptomonas pyrrhocoris]KPA76471.1 hypothetical protein ABB37_07783 [Leptomonas pyrrhocoris]|eukprot:XP_015654910.1 hypothetical protein ABB37_07783 [Leptomonas pyrrhocoris]
MDSSYNYRRTPPRSRSLPPSLHHQLEPTISPHPYAPRGGSTAASLASSGAVPPWRQPPPPSTPPRTRRARSGAQRTPRTTATTAVALQQQYETTRFLSRLLAGVTLQWRQVVEQLNSSGVPLTAEGTVAPLPQPLPSPSSSAVFSSMSPSPADTAMNATQTYLQEGLHFDVQAHAARRERDKRPQQQSRQASLHRRRAGVHADAHPYNRENRNEGLCAPIAGQQLERFKKAEEHESDELAKRAERTTAANWTSLAPSAQWVPYVVGGNSVDNGDDNDDGDDVWHDGRYDGVLYASSNAPHSRRRSTRRSRSRRARYDEEEEEDAASWCDPDDEARLRTAVLHGMARSAAKMVMGMRQVQQVLPASAVAFRSHSASNAQKFEGQHALSPLLGTAPSASPCVAGIHRTRTPPRRHSRRHQRDISLGRRLARTQSKPRADSARQRGSSPSPLSPHWHKRIDAQDEVAKPTHQRSQSAVELRERARQATATTIVYPALPVAQRTWIYQRISDGDGEGTAINTNGHGDGSSTRPSRHRHHRRAASPSKSAATPSLRGVTPITERDVGVSLMSGVAERSHTKNGACGDADERQRRHPVTSPLHAHRQLDRFSGAASTRAVLADEKAAEKIGGTPNRKDERRSIRRPADRLLHQAHLSVVVHAETEARLRIALHHERSLKSMLQAHFHRLWRLRENSGDGDAARTVQKAAKEEELPTRRRGLRSKSTGDTSNGEAAGLPLSSVSVSPLSSSPFTPSSSPVRTAAIHSSSRNVLGANPQSRSASAAASASSLSVKPASRFVSPTHLPAPAAVEGVASAFRRLAGQRASSASASPSIPPPPPQSFLKVYAPAYEAAASPIRHASRSLPPPPSAYTRPLTEPRPVSAKILISPSNEPAARSARQPHQQQRTKDWDISLPPPTEAQEWNGEDAGGTAHEPASTRLQKYVQQGAGLRSSVSPVSLRRGKRRSAEGSVPATPAAMEDDVDSADRGATVALELFPASPLQEASAAEPRTPSPKLRRPPLLSPPPPTATAVSEPPRGVVEVVAVPLLRAHLSAPSKTRPSELEVTINDHDGAVLARATRRRSAGMSGDAMIAESRKQNGRAGDDPSNGKPNPVSVVAKPQVAGSGDEPPRSVTRGSSSDTTNSSNTTVRYTVQSAPAPAPEAASPLLEDEVSHYSSVSSFYSGLPECVPSAETDLHEVTLPANRAARIAANGSADLSPKAAPELEQDHPTTPSGVADNGDVPSPSPPPRSPSS